MTLARDYTRDGVTLTVDIIRKVAEYLPRNRARERLEAWEKGRGDCDYIFKPAIPNHHRNRMSSIDASDLGPRRRIDDIKISAFERKLGAEIEERYMKGVTRPVLSAATAERSPKRR